MARSFKAAKAKRDQVPLLIGVMGPPGGGKTVSSLRLASGIQRIMGGPIRLIDTEGRRALKYADSFDFEHVTFDPPFSPSDFKDAIEQQLADKPATIIVDSLSDEHEGSGGVLDWHDKELDRMAGDDWKKRERVGQAAWIKPKRARLDLINAMTQIKVPLILTFRAREKVKQIKNDRGKMEPTNIGYQPIAPMEIVHQLDLTCLLPPRANGIPVWRSDKAGEDFIIKLPSFLQPFIKEGEALSEDMGAAFAKWALGDAPAGGEPAPTQPAVDTEASAKKHDMLIESMKLAKSVDDLMQWYKDNSAAIDGLADEHKDSVRSEFVAVRADLQNETAD